MPKGRIQIPADLAGLLRSEWELIIEQASLGAEDSAIVRGCIVDKTPQIDVADELGIHRSTISHRLPNIIRRVRQVAKKLDMIDK